MSDSISRRRFLHNSMALTLGATVLGGSANSEARVAMANDKLASRTGTLGVALVTSREKGRFRADLLSLRDGKVLTTLENFHAAHAVVPVETLNRFIVHGREMASGQSVILTLQVNPLSETWQVLSRHELDGGMPLHWQPNRQHSLIQYNTIGDRRLHVLDTQTLELESFVGGGPHSNMAFFHQDEWLIATDRLRGETTLRAIDRMSDEILFETPAGEWGHGVTVNDKTQRAFVWANDGLHIISLAKENLGEHLGVEHLPAGQRCWFCWTPQGGRYSHDQTWNPGDSFSPWLTVVDLEKTELRKIPVEGEQLGTLGVAPDGSLGVCGSHSSNNICLFDIANNRFLGKAEVGRGNEAFFDRDVSFSRDRATAFVTDPRDRTLSAVNVRQMKRVGTIDLPAEPEWMKVLTV